MTVAGMEWAGMDWANPPPAATQGPEGLTVVTGEATDFWRGTFYGFTRASGHFLHQPVEGDFSAEVTIRGQYQALYDQAGLMLRVDDETWVKCGVEHTDGRAVFSTVVTNGWSDWSVMPLPFDVSDVRLRVTRHAEAVRVQVRGPEGWIMARLGYLRPGPARVGPMCCSPTRAGFRVSFAGYTCGPPIPRDLHGDSA